MAGLLGTLYEGDQETGQCLGLGLVVVFVAAENKIVTLLMGELRTTSSRPHPIRMGRKLSI